MLPAIALFCSLVPQAQVSAVDDPLLEVTAQRVELDEPEHGHAEHDTSMLEHTLMDFGVPTITGGFVASHQSPELLEAANRGMAAWWATMSLGRGFVPDERADWRSNSDARQSIISSCADVIDYRAGNSLSRNISTLRLTNSIRGLRETRCVFPSK
jgi:hypothetical protein